MAALLLLVVFASAADPAGGPEFAQPPSVAVPRGGDLPTTLDTARLRDVTLDPGAVVGRRDVVGRHLGPHFRRAGLDGTDAASTTTCSERPSVKEAMAADRAGQRLP